eukprot:PITA_07707
MLKEEVYVAQPPGYEVEGKEDKVYMLRKDLYGLKQALHVWYSRVDAYLLDNGYDKCDSELNLHIKESDGKILIVILYVDDLILIGSDDFLIIDFKEVMKSEFEMTYLGGLSNWVGSVDEKKSTPGYVFHLGSRAISWASKKQPIVSLSTTEVEYVAATTTTCQAVWMKRMLKDLCHEQVGMTTILCDNTSAIALSKNFVFHKRTKHIDAKYHFIIELINNDEIVLQHCKLEEQFADICTNPLARDSFVYLRDCFGIINGNSYDSGGVFEILIPTIALNTLSNTMLYESTTTELQFCLQAEELKSEQMNIVDHSSTQWRV